MKASKHWSLQRVTAILLLPLSYWLLAFLYFVLNANYLEFVEWLTIPFNKTALIFWVIMACYHATMGLQVVLEDYVSKPSKQLTTIWTAHSFFAILGLIAVILLLRI